MQQNLSIFILEFDGWVGFSISHDSSQKFGTTPIPSDLSNYFIYNGTVWHLI